MARYPGAVWRPISGHTDGPIKEHLGAVLHVNQSNGNLFNWVNGDHDVSCHFEVYKTGVIEQYLDTSMDSWCQKDGNETYLSIETEGYTTEPLTAAAQAAIAKLYAWLHTTHGIPFTLADKPGERGFGWHGMGGEAWGHPLCPGEIRKGQRAGILKLAQAVHTVNTPPPPAALPKAIAPDGYRFKVYAAWTGGSPYACAPGRFVKLDATTLELLINHGECDGVIHRTHYLTQIRNACVGANS